MYMKPYVKNMQDASIFWKKVIDEKTEGCIKC